MNYIIYTKDFDIYQIGDRQGTADHKGLRSFFLGPKQPVAVAAVRVTSNLFQIEDKGADIEAAAVSFFGEGYMVQTEKLDADNYQVFGLEKDLINEIHHTLYPEEITLITPYVLALRRYIDSLNITRDNRYVLFLECIKERNTVFLSVFYNKRHLLTRDIRYNLDNLPSEIARDIQGFSTGVQAIDFFCIANSEEISACLLEKEVFNREKMITVKDPFPSIKGLEMGYEEFPHFIPESELLEQEKVRRHRRDLILLAGSALLCIFSLSMWLHFSSRLNDKQYELAALESEVGNLKAEIIKANRLKYIDYYSRRGKDDISSALVAFYRVLPPGCFLDSLSIGRQDAGYTLVAYLKKADISSKIEDLKGISEKFPGSAIEHIIIKEIPGYKITAPLAREIIK